MLFPMESKIARDSLMSSSVDFPPAAITEALSLTKAAMLGITRIRRNYLLRHDSIAARGTPAAIEMMSLDMSRQDAVSLNTDAMI